MRGGQWDRNPLRRGADALIRNPIYGFFLAWGALWMTIAARQGDFSAVFLDWIVFELTIYAIAKMQDERP